MIKGHGGNIQDAAAVLNCRVDELIDMSSNLNPLGPPEGLFEHLKSHMDEILRLPEVDAGGIVAVIARRYGLYKDHILAGNGTTQLIYTIPQALDPRRSIIVGPTYSDYADALSMYHRAFDFFLTSEADQFLPDLDALGESARTADCVFICNPNNPTGRLLEKEELVGMIEACPDTIFVIDESYLPFVSRAEEISFLHEPFMDNVLVLSSMSKIFRIPGLRTGFLMGPDRLIEKFRPFMTPWSVNSLAHAAVMYLSDDAHGIDAFIDTSVGFVTQARDRFLQQMKDVAGIRFFPSHTTFLLGRLSGGHTACGVYEALLQHRILIRNCANFRGLSDQFIRVSLKDVTTNDLLAEKLTQVLS